MLYITKSTMWLSFWRSVVLSHSYVFLFFDWIGNLFFIVFVFFDFQIGDCDFAAQMAPMHVRHAREVPEYEIDPKEIDFTNSVEITKVLFFFFFFHCPLLLSKIFKELLLFSLFALFREPG